jgi:hypothetical protein
MTERRYLPTIAELIDRLSICLMKSIFIDREAYRAEMKLIVEDIASLIDDPASMYPRSSMIYPILVLMLSNREIWLNEGVIRKGYDDPLGWAPEVVADKLRFTHSINGVRTRAKNEISKIFGERVDQKVDCLAADLPTEFGNWAVFDER